MTVAQRRPAAQRSVAARGGERPLVLLCECAGTMANIDFGDLEGHLAGRADVLRGAHWCGREGRARLLELMEKGEGRRLVFAGCAADFAAHRFRRLNARGLRMEMVDIREGCSWVHAGGDAAVTRKAMSLVDAVVDFPTATPDVFAHTAREDGVLIIGGGVAGTQAAAELAQMGHRVELVERRPFLGGRAARIGTVFPTNDCGQCLPTTEDQPGVRKCFHRNEAIDHPDLHIWRRTTVEAVTGRPGAFEVALRRLPNIVTEECVNCGDCEAVCPQPASEPGKKAIFHEYYDGRVVRTVDLETCSFCGACAEACPVDAIDFTQSPVRATVRAGAIVAATGCVPAPREHVEYLGYGHEGVVTQVDLSEMLPAWEEEAQLGRLPAREVVMVQCAGSRDLRFLPYCSRLCCMIALKHATRLRTLFPRMKVTICYLEMRTAGIGYENWFRAARRAGVEFLRGTPAEVQFDDTGRPVIEVEDVTAARTVELRPDLVVLSTGLVPAPETATLARVLGIELDEEGFIEILDRKNRATETTSEGVFVCGSAAGPKALIEVSTEASAVASEAHNFLRSPGRRGAPASVVDAATCVGCDVCFAMCPFGAVSLVERPKEAPRPAEVKDESKLAVIDEDVCRGCGVCAANCPELAITHNQDDAAILGRLATLTTGVERPIVGFYCRECAGAAISLGGQHRDTYPETVRLIELPCLGRVSALHIVEAVRLGAVAVFLAGCAENRCHYRSGDASAAEQVRVAEELLAQAGLAVPVELWHLCAVDRLSVGRRIRMFHGKTLHDATELADLEHELESIGSHRTPVRSPAPGVTAGEVVSAADGGHRDPAG
jgi:heterodisulfide reductase subunit A2